MGNILNSQEHRKTSTNSESSSKQYTLPKQMANRELVRQCIHKYNSKIDSMMSSDSTVKFLSERQRLITRMDLTCKEKYGSKEDKENCVKGINSGLKQQFDRMNAHSVNYYFMLAEKCLIYELRNAKTNLKKEKQKEQVQLTLDEGIQDKTAEERVALENCVQKLYNYRELNNKVHLLELQKLKETL